MNPNPSRILLLMSTRSYRAEAFLDAAAALGVAATVGTDHEQSLAFLNPAGNLTLDFDDPEAAADLAASFHKQHPITAVVAAEEDGLLLAAHIAERLDLAWRNPPESVRAARSKLEARERWRAAGLRTPEFRSVDLDAAPEPERLASALRYPCVLKPLSLSGSRGVIRADDPASFVAAFERLERIVAAAEKESMDRASDVGPASGATLRSTPSSGDAASSPGPPAPPRRILIEDFIPGRELALEGMLSAGALRVLALFDKPDPLDGPFFEETIYLTPSRLPAAVRAEIAQTVQRAATALGLREGPVHAEMRVELGDPEPPDSDASACVTMLELSPRSIGGLCSRSLRFVEAGVRDGARRGSDELQGAPERSFSYETLILRHALGRPIDGIEREPQASGVMMIPSPGAGILRRITGLEAARAVPGVEEVRMVVTPGTRMVPPPEACQYPGFVFARADTPEVVEEALREALRRLVFELDDSDPDSQDA